MLLLASIFIVAAIYVVSRIYSDGHGKLIPATTRKGKEARIILGLILVPGIVMVVLNNMERYKQGNLTTVWLLTLLVVISLPVFRYIQSRKKK